MKFDIINGHYFVHREDPNKISSPLTKIALSGKPGEMGLSALLNLVAGLLCAMEQAAKKHQDISALIDRFQEVVAGSNNNPIEQINLDKKLDAFIERLKQFEDSLKVLEGLTNTTSKNNEINLCNLT